MRKFLTTGLFGAILGLLVGAPADASLISRSFLDQALTDYATTTALDLKADKTDLTDLSDKIGTLPEGTIDIGGGGLSEMFGKEKSFPVTIPSDYTLSDAFQNLFYSAGVFPSFLDIAEYTMYGGTLSSYWESIHGIKTYKGLLELTKDIGTLPSGHMLLSKGLVYLLPDPEYYTYPTSIGDFMGQMYNGYLGLSGLAQAVYHGNALMGQTDTTLQIKGLRQITDEIGTLPDTLPKYYYDDGGQLAYTKAPASEIFTDAVNPVYSIGGVLSGILTGFAIDDQRILSLPEISTRTVKLSDQIGTLPTEIPNMDSTWTRYGFVETPGTPIDLPDTIGGMLAMLFNEDGLYNGLSLRNIMTKILLGFNGIEGLANLTSAYKLIGDSPIVTAVNANTAKIGTVPDGKNLAGMISETDAKIGTVPDGYETVGAALTAIKGIAEDAKAAALAAIPDPKTEGSTGKYVLTVDIVGDNATYRWEKIDREGETTTTTE